ncbi:hypothetical protein [Hymenobacter metallilatus]|nr:hypothetical protein [Hymenobacter metallilatus]
MKRIYRMLVLLGVGWQAHAQQANTLSGATAAQKSSVRPGS